MLSQISISFYHEIRKWSAANCILTVVDSRVADYHNMPLDFTKLFFESGTTDYSREAHPLVHETTDIAISSCAFPVSCFEVINAGVPLNYTRRHSEPARLTIMNCWSDGMCKGVQRGRGKWLPQWGMVTQAWPEKEGLKESISQRAFNMTTQKVYL